MITISFTPPLPCNVLIAMRRRCGNPATVATLTAQRDGTYVLQPVCQACTDALLKVYAPKEARP